MQCISTNLSLVLATNSDNKYNNETTSTFLLYFSYLALTPHLILSYLNQLNQSCSQSLGILESGNKPCAGALSRLPNPVPVINQSPVPLIYLPAAISLL